MSIEKYGQGKSFRDITHGGYAELNRIKAEQEGEKNVSVFQKPKDCTGYTNGSALSTLDGLSQVEIEYLKSLGEGNKSEKEPVENKQSGFLEYLKEAAKVSSNIIGLGIPSLITKYLDS